jgi:hypothetical protein
MEQSQFIEYIQKYFKGIVVSIVKLLNGKEEDATPTYRFKEMLTPKFSVDGKWQSIIGKSKNVKPTSWRWIRRSPSRNARHWEPLRVTFRSPV